MLQPNLPRPSVRTYTTIQHTDTYRQHSSLPAHNFPHLPLTSHAERNNFQIWPNRGKKRRQIVRISGALLCFDDLLPQLNVPQSCGFMREPQVGIWEQESGARVSLHQHVNVLLGLIKAAHTRLLQRLPDCFSNVMVNVDLERKSRWKVQTFVYPGSIKHILSFLSKKSSFASLFSRTLKVGAPTHAGLNHPVAQKQGFFLPLPGWDEAAVSLTDLSAGRWLEELLINAPGFELQLVCGATRPVVLARQPELHVFIAELRSQEVLEGF